MALTGWINNMHKIYMRCINMSTISHTTSLGWFLGLLTIFHFRAIAMDFISSLPITFHHDLDMNTYWIHYYCYYSICAVLCFNPLSFVRKWKMRYYSHCSLRNEHKHWEYMEDGDLQTWKDRNDNILCIENIKPTHFDVCYQWLTDKRAILAYGEANNCFDLGHIMSKSNVSHWLPSERFLMLLGSYPNLVWEGLKLANIQFHWQKIDVI